MIQLKIIEEAHELDCMEAANRFLSTLKERDVIRIQYSSSHFQSEQDQIYSFSVCIVYRIENASAG